jgi:hypothetical protein
LESALEKLLEGEYLRLKTLRNHVIDNPNFLQDRYLFTRARSLKEKMALAIASWFLPEIVGVLIRMDLEEKLKYLSLEDQTQLSLCLESKAECLLFLIETRLWHSRDFFGNMVPRMLKQVSFIKFKRIKPRKVVPSQRKRGYDDHGSRVPDHKILPKSDWSLTELQNEKELKEDRQKDTLEFLRGFLW